MSSAVRPDATAPTEFLDPRAVDTWDGAFRWRHDGVLRDLTIEDTWTRVAGALTRDAARQRAYREAFARWQLLPDARLLRFAGTGERLRLTGRIAAVLNAFAFVTRRRFDYAAFAAAATLARTLLDDARALQPPGFAAQPGGIGLIGFEEAREALGIAPASPEAREFALRLVAAMAAQAGHQRIDLAPQPLLARLANHVSDGFDAADRESLLAAVRP